MYEISDIINRDWSEVTYKQSTLKIGNPALAKEGDFIYRTQG